MDELRQRTADEIYKTSRAHDKAQPDRLLRFRNVEPETAALLSLFILAGRCRRVLEIGTSNGYSTIWLADAAEQTGGRVLSIDIDATRTELAAENLSRTGLGGRVELITEDAAQTLRRAPDDTWDFIFLDAERPAYMGYLPDLVRTLTPFGVLAIDNVLSHADELTDFTAAIEMDERLAQTVVPVGAGLRLAVRRAHASG